jgi:site-specific recombinase XerD
VRRLTAEDLIDLARCDAQRKGNRTAFRYGTAEQPRQGVKNLLETFGGTPALNITADDVDRYGDRRIADGAKPATVNRELAMLRHGFQLTVRKNLIPSAPAISMRSERGNERQGFVTPEQFDGFLIQLKRRDGVVADVAEAA